MHTYIKLENKHYSCCIVEDRIILRYSYSWTRYFLNCHPSRCTVEVVATAPTSISLRAPSHQVLLWSTASSNPGNWLICNALYRLSWTLAEDQPPYPGKDCGTVPQKFAHWLGVSRPCAQHFWISHCSWSAAKWRITSAIQRKRQQKYRPRLDYLWQLI